MFFYVQILSRRRLRVIWLIDLNKISAKILTQNFLNNMRANIDSAIHQAKPCWINTFHFQQDEWFACKYVFINVNI